MFLWVPPRVFHLGLLIPWHAEAPAPWLPQCLPVSASFLVTFPACMSTGMDSLSGKCSVDSLPQGPRLISLHSPLLLSPRSASSRRSTEHLNVSSVSLHQSLRSPNSGESHVAVPTPFPPQQLYSVPVGLNARN